MPILLADIWPIEDQDDFKIHFARWNNHAQPLEVLARDREEWRGWQEYYPGRNDFNRQFIFSLAQFYHEPGTWLFGGVFRVLERHADRYVVEETDRGAGFVGRLKLLSDYRSRTTRTFMQPHYDQFIVKEITREPYAGLPFPGMGNIDLAFDELSTLVRNDRPDWRGALETAKGIYLVTDTRTTRRYVGSAHGENGIWARWSNYVETGHGGNVELRNLVDQNGLEYCQDNFRFALLEDHRMGTSDDVILAREAHWKRILLARGEDGLNRN
ncbi:GIY-YIG nuclease family protein [Ruegeria sp. HKCCD7318]|uniref:GIY-YIG nuclease family protein n=1 Tax=Ruegeria sp. HKCCD7318 TaxID=2683014 RepID=UPI0014909AF8|nr:GIY-YIG nuclease family protein [Ruegeria sp. HKCCD7318]NOE36239.1 GIY-YIG nuclease family protein [Ruegeria sp. HKCCD7318]